MSSDVSEEVIAELREGLTLRTNLRGTYGIVGGVWVPDRCRAGGPRPTRRADEPSVAYWDVSGQPMPSWAVGVDPIPDERGPPVDYDGVDPPAPND